MRKVLVRHGFGLQEGWRWAAGESRAPAVAGAVGGGAFGHRPFVGGIDAATPSFPCLTSFGENPRSAHAERTMMTLSALLGVISPLEDIVLKVDSAKGTRCSCWWFATTCIASP